MPPRLTDHADLKRLCQRIHWDPRVDHALPPREDGSDKLTATRAGIELQRRVLGAVLDSGVANGTPKSFCCKLVLAHLGYGTAVDPPKSIRPLDASFIQERAAEAARRVDPELRLPLLLGDRKPVLR